MTVDIRIGDCRELMKDIEPCSIDACVTDPPYHLTSIVKRFGAANAAPAKDRDGLYARASAGFMGKQWDGVETPNLTAAMGHWLAGFSDGEGCFTTRKSGAGFVCEFIIHLRADDSEILKSIHRATGIGDVSRITERNDASAPMVKWVVRRQADCAKLIQIFEAFPLRAKKRRDFEIWASAVREWIAHEPGTSWADLRSHAEMLSAVKLYGAAFNPSQFFHYRWARLVFDALKPGAHLIAFGGTRTYHRLAAAIEDAGFDVRDQMQWIYGAGFPKSHNAGNGWGTALKPAHEPIVLARKPLIGTVAANVQQHGTGAINVDGCRVDAGPDGKPLRGNHAARPALDAATSYDMGSGYALGTTTQGRWPANVIHDGSEEVLAAFPDATGAHAPTGPMNGSTKTLNVYGKYQTRAESNQVDGGGSAARFFYTAKADAEDRLGSKHPTVKPVDLIAYLCRLITPTGGTVLDPFAGSGTTGMACMREGFNAVLIEREAEYVADIRRRIAHVQGLDAPLFAEVAAQ